MMSTLATTALLLFLTHGALTADDGKAKTVVNVDVYYEALCGDSIRFIKYQLVPSYPELKEHLKINFVPYGKASHRREETGRWTFRCQHGPIECIGNEAQACALDAIEKTEKPEDHQQLSVKLVGCVMTSYNPATGVQRCAQTVGLSEATKKRISDCEGSTEGGNLLAAHGDKTLALNPNLSFVPTIVINGSRENQGEALSNFKGQICGLIPQDERPLSCLKS